MFYLNDAGTAFEGGCTEFLEAAGPRSDDETAAEAVARGCRLTASVEPRAGRVVLFNHDLLHRGAPVPRGVKYIGRSDVVFVRTPGSGPAGAVAAARQDPRFRRSQAMYRRAQRAEVEGDVVLSSELYERALALRQSQAAPEGF